MTIRRHGRTCEPQPSTARGWRRWPHRISTRREVDEMDVAAILQASIDDRDQPTGRDADVANQMTCAIVEHNVSLIGRKGVAMNLGVAGEREVNRVASQAR